VKAALLLPAQAAQHGWFEFVLVIAATCEKPLKEVQLLRLRPDLFSLGLLVSTHGGSL